MPNLAWQARGLRPSQSETGGVGVVGEVAILEGDAELLSGMPGSYGLRFDEARNDLGAVVGRYASRIADVPGILLVFTSFVDQGAGGPAYFVPIYNEVEGTGLGPIDQRADFGTERFEGLINMKRIDDHGDRLRDWIAHEISHRHLAYASVAPTEGSTIAPSILGRQGAHWHAALHSEGSLLGGHGYRKNGDGRFVVIAKEETLSSLDRYLLGLARPESVEPFLFIEDAHLPSGAALPADAQLALGQTVEGTERVYGALDVIAAIGPRHPDFAAAPKTLQVVFCVLTTPEQSASDPEILELAQRVDRLRSDVESDWLELTGGVGSLCTRTRCGPDEDAGDSGDAGPGRDPGDSCACSSTSTPSRPYDLGLLLALSLVLGLRTRKRTFTS